MQEQTQPSLHNKTVATPIPSNQSQLQQQHIDSNSTTQLNLTPTSNTLSFGAICGAGSIIGSNANSSGIIGSNRMAGGGIGIIGGLLGSVGGDSTDSNFTIVGAVNKGKKIKSQTALNEHKDQDLLVGASRSTTPMSHVSQKSGSPDMIAQQQQHQGQHPNQHTGQGGSSRDAAHKRQNHQHRGGNNQRNNDFYQQSRDRRDSGRHMDGNYNNQHHDLARGGNNYNNQRNNQRGGGGGGGGQSHTWTMHRGGPNNGNI
ncbi:unnamed protein product [Ceratitis capitata]|uniref:(Mediterranean fruit fly) hypothetical protein n=1 Tax=Ceratitis capitata TaxID=7213 RepID=A0A811UZR6_CERCA|nr:unnamed protein product [Ceratitis capitata]